MNILSWNCRGLSSNSSPLHSFISNLTITSTLDFIFLTETKCNVTDLEPIFNTWGFKGYTGVNSDNSSGGLFLC